MTKIIDFIKAHALVIGGVVVFALLAVALREHDARLREDATIKAAQTGITAMQTQQSNIAKTAKTKVAALQQEATKIDTPSKAVEVLTTPSTAMIPELQAEALPDTARVSVDALPLYQALNTCQQDKVNLSACSQELQLQKDIDVKKDEQLKAAEGKPSFWHRVGKVAKVTACAAGGGFAGGYIKGAEGAAVGAAAGAGICQLF